MKQEEFDALVADTVAAIQKLLVVKGGEYAGSADRLANFKRGADLASVTPLQCAFIYAAKHYDAIATFVRDDAAGRVRQTSEPIDGRLDDLINYCILMKGLIAEGRGMQAVHYDPRKLPSASTATVLARSIQPPSEKPTQFR